MALSVDTTPAKHVTVLRNGDGKFGGRKFIISRRRYRTFDSLLSDITHQISAPFGAVRRLYTPKGSRQIQGIDDLEGGATYVAGGTERFKRIEYTPIQLNGNNGAFSSNLKPGFLADDPPPLVLPKKNRKYAQRSAQFHKVRQPVQFTVFRNGLPGDKGARFLLKSREMKSYETVLSIISFKIRLVEGAVRKLYTVEGSILSGPDDITDGGQYVACGHRRFMAGIYGMSAQPAKLNKLPAIKRNRNVNQQSPRTQSNPLPAIQKKAPEASQKTARSDKDSPAPIAEEKESEDEKEEEATHDLQNGVKENGLVLENGEKGLENGGRESTIPDMITEEGDEESISRTEVNTVPNKSKLPASKKSNQSISSETLQDVSSKSTVASKTKAAASKTGVPASKTKSNKKTSKKNQELITDDGLFNATGAPTSNQDGNFLMNNTHEGESRPEDEDAVDEDNDLIEDKPVALQQAQEVDED